MIRTPCATEYRGPHAIKSPSFFAVMELYLVNPHERPTRVQAERRKGGEKEAIHTT